MKRYRASWLYTGEGSPQENAMIDIEHGRILGISFDTNDAIDLGEVAIVPGLINAHTHLEFSAITSPLEPLTNFPAWIRSVIRRRQESEFGIEASILSGLDESRLSGVTSIAEIATKDWRNSLQIQESRSLPSKTLMFREYLGLSDEAAQSQLVDAEKFLQANCDAGFVAGLSPHAPYSLHPELFEDLCRLAKQYQAPLAMHLAESPAEIELLQTGGGPLAEMLTEIGVYRPEFFANRLRPLDFLKRLDCGVPTLIIHGNLLNDEEMRFISESPSMSVVYCPRTHAAMQSSAHPWQKMIELGINVTIGTDSRASNPDLSIWNELCFLAHQTPTLATSYLLKLSTVNAAKALNLRDQGSLENGKAANLCLIPLTKESSMNPEESLLQPTASPQGIMMNGEWSVRPICLKKS